jgi:predicted regulator of Ras-like GTPase activity (Roadblock/LC7/MglB family)
MFKDALRSVVENTEGGLAGLLMDFQGVSVESYTRGDAPLDIDTVGAEFSVVVKQIQRAAESLEAGGAHEVAVLAEKMVTVIRVVNQDYFLAVALQPGGNIGKARYLLRTTAPQVLHELE